MPKRETNSRETTKGHLPISIVILTYNEEINIADCIGSLADVSDDIHILDSYSTDNTVQIARDLGVPVHQNRFDGFGNQRNWAIDNIPHRHEWVFHLDADERFTGDLRDEIQLLVERMPSEAGFYVPNRLMLGDRWLRYSSGYPVYQLRLFHRSRLRFENYGHGQREVTDGKLGYLTNGYEHYNFSHGLDEWFAKHAKYARAEAQRARAQNMSLVQLLRKFLFATAIERRRVLKSLTFFLPFRSYLRLFHTLILKRGILDGRSGWTYAKMLAIYESMLTLQIRQLKSGAEPKHQGSSLS
jgi:glycosyltransferase involved in cell wall biosynthesis